MRLAQLLQEFAGLGPWEHDNHRCFWISWLAWEWTLKMLNRSMLELLHDWSPVLGRMLFLSAPQNQRQCGQNAVQANLFLAAAVPGMRSWQWARRAMHWATERTFSLL